MSVIRRPLCIRELVIHSTANLSTQGPLNAAQPWGSQHLKLHKIYWLSVFLTCFYLIKAALSLSHFYQTFIIDTNKRPAPSHSLSPHLFSAYLHTLTNAEQPKTWATVEKVPSFWLTVPT